MSAPIMIKTPDGAFFLPDDYEEARAYVMGFCAALDCYGAWRDGVQRIGCAETPIRDVKLEMVGALEAARAAFEKRKTGPPHTVFWFPNGMAAVLDNVGRQIAGLQGTHAETIAALEAAGIDWMKLAEVHGLPFARQDAPREDTKTEDAYE